MKIALSTLGSRGDVQPLIMLAKEFQRRGYHPYICAPSDYKNFCEENGVPFRTVTHDFKEKLIQLNNNKSKMIALMRESVEAQIKDLTIAAKDADAIIATGVMMAASSVAEKMKIPYFYIGFCPTVFYSEHHPSMSFPFYNMPRILNRLSWKFSDIMWKLIADKPLNKWRKEENLPPLKNFAKHIMPDNYSIIAADPLLAPPPPDFTNICQTSYLSKKSENTILSDEIENFLAKGEKPLYVGFGSMMDKNHENLTSKILKASEKTGTRLIICSGWGKTGEKINKNNVLVIKEAPHEILFPRCLGALHHGGAGTTHTALYAGIPQIIIPHILDQFYWANQIYKQKLGPKPIPRLFVTEKKLIKAFSELKKGSFSSASNLSQMKPDGAEITADLVLEMLGKNP